MGSFQQIFMGGTCLVAAFFFGSYLHNRPAENEQVSSVTSVDADPLETFLSFSKKPAADQRTAQSFVAQTQPSRASSQPTVATVSGIDPSELAPSIQQAASDSAATADKPRVVNKGNRKSVVPDFSELASRFRNTPLELAQPESPASNKSGVHESERAPFSNVFEAPKMVVRQPESTQPLNRFNREANQVEEAIRGEFSAVNPQTTRWRVNRTRELDQFRRDGEAPRQDLETRETIEDVLSRRSADYLQNEESSKETWATNPPQDNYSNARRREITMNAARRNQNILDIEDPGNRFHSVLTQPENVAPPEPDVETAYYTPSAKRQDIAPPTPRGNLKPLKTASEPQWGRQSNIQTRFQNTYEIQAGDTLQSISTRFYGTPKYYLELYKANKQVLKRIASSSYVGVVIEIPQLNN